MESLRGIFPRQQPQPKRDFLKENVMRIRSMQSQRMRKSKDTSEYSNKFNKQYNPRKLSLCENSNGHRSANSLALCSSKAPINNLRKAVSSMSLSSSREIGVQTIDPETDQFFLKDSIIRYPSASTIRSISTSQQTTSTCSRGHFMDDNRPKYKSRRDVYGERLEKHSSNMSDLFEKGLIGKKPASILKSSSSLQKLNKDSLNESQQKVDRIKSGSANRVRTEAVVISDDENSEEGYSERNGAEETDKDQRREKKELKIKSTKDEEKLRDDTVSKIKEQQLKAAAEDPNCPEGHVPLSEEERLESLKIAQKRARVLIDELNRLPMTCETLRVRTRKIEIEKELRALDVNIRVFSRPKVYVKLNE